MDALLIKVGIDKHLLKDPDTVVSYHKGELPTLDASTCNAPVQCDATLEAVLAALRR